MGDIKIKQHLYNICFQHIENSISEVQNNLSSIQESKNNETKSSAGDKYETGMSMLQLEEDKLRGQLLKLIKSKNQLLQIDAAQQIDNVRLGAVVYTNIANYFISIAKGKVEIEGKTFYCVSVISPIVQIMLGKKTDEEFNFNGKKIRISKII